MFYIKTLRYFNEILETCNWFEITLITIVECKTKKKKHGARGIDILKVDPSKLIGSVKSEKLKM